MARSKAQPTAATAKKPAAKKKTKSPRKKPATKDTKAASPPEPEAIIPDWPAWLTDGLVTPTKAKIASAFVVHGNTGDLFPNPDRGVEDDQFIPSTGLWRKFLDALPMVMFYDVAAGLTFLRPEMEEEFRDLAGLNVTPDSDGGSDTDSLLAQANAQMAATQEIPRDPNGCLALVDRVLRTKEKSVLVVRDAHFVFPDSGANGMLPPNERVLVEMAKNWGRDEEIRDTGSAVFLLAPEAYQVSVELRGEDSEVRQVCVPKPNDALRLAYIRSLTAEPEDIREAQAEMEELAEMCQRPGLRKKTRERYEQEIQDIYDSIQDVRAEFSLPAGLTAETMTRATQGMSLRQVREIFLEARQSGAAISLGFVKAKKREILNREYGDVMEVVDAKRGLEDIGGHEKIKAYFRRVLDAIRRGEDRLVPMGVLLSGPPGTGKTAIVKSLAHDAGYNFVETKNIRDMWVGSSEARMEKLINGLKALAPVVVMNDEADLKDADRSAPKGDSGVSERLMKAWMEFVSDPDIRGKVIIISCTNRPDRLDAALKRSGRNDARILMAMPAVEERKAIFAVMVTRHDIDCDVTDYTPMAEATGRLSGADIELVVQQAFDFADQDGRSSVTDADLHAAIEDFIPSSNQKEIDEMTMSGLSVCASKKLRPDGLEDILAGILERRLVPGLDAIMADLRSRGMLEGLDLPAA